MLWLNFANFRIFKMFIYGFSDGSLNMKNIKFWEFSLAIIYATNFDKSSSSIALPTRLWTWSKTRSQKLFQEISSVSPVWLIIMSYNTKWTFISRKRGFNPIWSLQLSLVIGTCISIISDSDSPSALKAKNPDKTQIL